MFSFFKKHKVAESPSRDEEEFEKRQGKSACVYAVRQTLIVQSESGRGLLHSDPDAFHCFLPLDADDDTLGKTLTNALAASRFLGSEEADNFMNSSEARWSEWVSKMLAATGIKNKQQLFHRMASCGVDARDGTIKFTPTVKRRGASWEGRDAKYESTVSLESSTRAIGAALREAINKCIPAVANAAQQSASADRREDAAPAER